MKALWPYLFINGIFECDDYIVPNWSQNITNPEKIKDIILTKLQRDIYKTKNLGIFSYIKLLQDLTTKYGLEEPELLTYTDFDVDKRIIFTSYCRVGNQTVIATRNIAIITENEATF